MVKLFLGMVVVVGVLFVLAVVSGTVNVVLQDPGVQKGLAILVSAL